MHKLSQSLKSIKTKNNHICNLFSNPYKNVKKLFYNEYFREIKVISFNL